MADAFSAVTDVSIQDRMTILKTLSVLRCVWFTEEGLSVPREVVEGGLAERRYPLFRWYGGKLPWMLEIVALVRNLGSCCEVGEFTNRNR